MTEKLFDVLSDEELKNVKENKEIRNVRLKDLTLEEIELLGKAMWPTAPKGTVNYQTVIDTFKIRKAL